MGVNEELSKIDSINLVYDLNYINQHSEYQKEKNEHI
jgi:hypothetical protein